MDENVIKICREIEMVLSKDKLLTWELKRLNDELFCMPRLVKVELPERNRQTANKNI
jgi:hypothetical protein